MVESCLGKWRSLELKFGLSWISNFLPRKKQEPKSGWVIHSFWGLFIYIMPKKLTLSNVQRLFSGGTKIVENWNPVVFLVPSLPCSKKNVGGWFHLIDWALKRNQSPWLIEARPSYLRKKTGMWYHDITPAVYMRISRLRIFYAFFKAHLCSTSRMSGAQTSSDSFLQTLGSLTLSCGRIKYCRWKPLRIYGSERAAPEIVSSA